MDGPSSYDPGCQPSSTPGHRTAVGVSPGASGGVPAVDTASGTPLTSNNSVRFGAPGKYDFYCMIHPFMKATVTVQ